MEKTAEEKILFRYELKNIPDRLGSITAFKLLKYICWLRNTTIQSSKIYQTLQINSVVTGKKKEKMKKKNSDSLTNKILAEKDSEMKQQNCREK